MFGINNMINIENCKVRNLLNRTMIYDKNSNQKCNCKECVNVKSENQTIEYSSLSDEEIEQIIKERYSDKDEKTKTFIRKALRKHGDRYDYSNVIYVKAKVEVEIICRVEGHKPFRQTLDAHTQGQGCKLCAIKKRADSKRLTVEEFIEKSNKKHGEGTYDYSKVEYINNSTDVIIICPKHGPFPQTPNDHLSGSGCPKCNKNKGEESVRKFLTEKGIEFEEQKTFNGCEYKRKLKFDFYLPKYNLCIESDGNIHSEKINWNGKMTDKEMEENLKSNQHRDSIKNEYCKKNGITLLRVNNFKAVEELTEYFQMYEIIPK